MAEALAFREGIALASNLGCTRVILESDSLEVVQACRGDIIRGEIAHVVQAINKFKSNFLWCGFTWVNRNANRATDLLAKMTNASTLPQDWMWRPPAQLRQILSEDFHHNCSSSVPVPPPLSFLTFPTFWAFQYDAFHDQKKIHSQKRGKRILLLPESQPNVKKPLPWCCVSLRSQLTTSPVSSANPGRRYFLRRRHGIQSHRCRSPLADGPNQSTRPMPRYKDEPPAVRVFTVCDESRYLIVRNVPALGCGDVLLQLFSSYGEVEECKPMDAEDCEPFTDVCWIKFRFFSNARFAKRKLDDFVFLGNRLQVSYAPHFESLSDTQNKLEGRRKEVLMRLDPKRSKETTASSSRPLITSKPSCPSEHLDPNERDVEFEGRSHNSNLPKRMVSSNEDYFASHSMNQTVRLVRDKLDKIHSSGEHLQAGSAPKKTRIDNRRRI